MNNQWFRSWHGAPTDPKWIVIARRASERIRTHPNAANAGVVSAVFWALMDCASQATDRGNVAGFDVESYAAFTGFEEAAVTAIVEAMKEKKIIENNRLKEWDKRQPKREDGSAERAKEWRERKRTHANANEHREDKIRIDKREPAHSAEIAGQEKNTSRRKPKVPFPDGFTSSEDTLNYGKALGLSDSEMVRETERFRLHAMEQDRRCANWQMALRKWFIKASEFRKTTPPQLRDQIDWERHILNFKSSANLWPGIKLGPEPGAFGCRVPKEILEKHGYGKKSEAA